MQAVGSDDVEMGFEPITNFEELLQLSREGQKMSCRVQLQLSTFRRSEPLPTLLIFCNVNKGSNYGLDIKLYSTKPGRYFYPFQTVSIGAHRGHLS